MSQNNLAIILSGGVGKRFDKNTPKQFFKINGNSILEVSVNKFIETKLFKQIIIVTHKDYLNFTKKIFKNTSVDFVIGGDTRQKSVLNGLKKAQHLNINNVLIHDSVRPLVSKELILNILKKLNTKDCVIPMLSMKDSIRKFNNKNYEDIERKFVKIIQTPQGFKYKKILKAHLKLRNENLTDDSIIASRCENKINMIKGEINNIKITTKEDLVMANKLNDNSKKLVDVRVGHGFDVHEFENGSKIILFGIKIPFDRKLKGHSDADVGFHAITDAILGSIGKGDIGEHFPPSNSKWKNKNSKIFLIHAYNLLQNKGFIINNIDITLICEKPKINKFRVKIKENISNILKIKLDIINIKATTTERLGFLGREEGIACQVITTVARYE